MPVASSLDYPSQRWGLLSPPEPMLLDTCLVQHLEFVMDLLDEALYWPEGAQEWLRRRYGEKLGGELIALGELVRFLLPRQGPPWIVSETSRVELKRLGGAKGSRLRAWWTDWAHYWDACVHDYPELATTRDQPEVALTPGQLALFELPPCPEGDLRSDGPLGPLRDAGDRALVREAVRYQIPAILTTDLRSLWVHRRWLYQGGVEVWRPRDVLATCSTPATAVPAAA